jgi:tetratricopeptide (TPR) repeat protein
LKWKKRIVRAAMRSFGYQRLEGLLPLGIKVMESAEEILKTDLNDAIRNRGKEHRETLLARNSLACLLGTRGKLEEAETLYRQALKARKRVLGEDDPDTLISVNGLAVVLDNRGKLEEAEHLYERALEAKIRVLGENHPSTLSSIYNYALLLHNRGKFAGAEAQYCQALEARKRILGENHPDYLNSASGLAHLLLETDRKDEAKTLFEDTLDAQKRVLGVEHPDTLNTFHGLACVLFKLGKWKEAEEKYRIALETSERVLGKNHLDTVSTVKNLAILLDDCGKLEEAEALFRRVLKTTEGILGQNHSDTLSSVKNLANLLYKRENLAEAEQLYRRALAGRLNVLGVEHADTLRSYNNLARLLYRRGDVPGAEEQYRQAVEGRLNKLGLKGLEHNVAKQTWQEWVKLLKKHKKLNVNDPIHKLIIHATQKGGGALGVAEGSTEPSSGSRGGHWKSEPECKGKTCHNCQNCACADGEQCGNREHCPKCHEVPSTHAASSGSVDFNRKACYYCRGCVETLESVANDIGVHVCDLIHVNQDLFDPAAVASAANGTKLKKHTRLFVPSNATKFESLKPSMKEPMYLFGGARPEYSSNSHIPEPCDYHVYLRNIEIESIDKNGWQHVQLYETVRYSSNHEGKDYVVIDLETQHVEGARDPATGRLAPWSMEWSSEGWTLKDKDGEVVKYKQIMSWSDSDDDDDDSDDDDDL